MSTKIIRNYVAKKLYEKGGTIANRKSVDFSTAAMAERLTEFGIDPRLINTESELIGVLNIVKQMQDKAFDKQFGGILKGSKFDKRAEVFDLEGKKIPDPERNIMGGQAFETEEEIAERIAKQNKESVKKFKEKMKDDPEEKASGGRIGLKMGRRAFLKALGAGIGGAAALKSGIVSLGGKTAGKEAVKQVIKTPSVAGKPEWFDSLVNKVIREGDDVSKNFATKEREIVHKLDIDNLDDVKVTQDLDEGLIRVEYNSPNNMGEDTVELVFKKGRPEEEGMMPDEFYAVEKEPRAVGGPEDADLEFDGENLVKNVDDLQSDTSKLKQVATGKKQTMSEFVNSKKKKDKVKSINEDQVEQAEYLETKYGPYERYLSEDVDADFASGGIARMLGE